MSLNPYFNNYDYKNEQDLYEDMVVESIEMYGMQFFYLPRNTITKDDVLREGNIVHYDKAIPITAYFKGDNGWGGDGNFLSKLGPQIRDSFTLVAAMRSFRVEAEQYRPMEGDLIWVPLNKKLFQIQFVNHEVMFYELGKLYSWDIPCTLFEYSGEKFNTGNPDIDDKYNALSDDLANAHIGDTESNDITTPDLGDFFLDEAFGLKDKGAQNDVFKKETKTTINRSEIDPFGVDN